MTYVKLGQFLAMRFDIVPREICRELANLFEYVAPMSVYDARSRVESEPVIVRARSMAAGTRTASRMANMGRAEWRECTRDSVLDLHGNRPDGGLLKGEDGKRWW